MTRYLYGDDPEPDERIPAGRLLVPVRPGPCGDVLRLFRTPLGTRAAVGFTSATQLVAVLGPDQASITIAKSELRRMAVALGIAALTIDPQLAAAPAGALEGPDRWRVPAAATRLTARPRVA